MRLRATKETREEEAARNTRYRTRQAEQEARIVREMHEYLTERGARENAHNSHGNVRDYELDTLHGPARVTVFPERDDPWLAVRFEDVERAVAAMPGAVHLQDLNRFSGKYNCHPIGTKGDTERILAAFRRHLSEFLPEPKP
jgi:hypothetical protein